MNTPKSSFRIILLFIAALLSAWFSLPGLTVNYIPEEKNNSLSLIFSLPANSPEAVEMQATSIIENACSGLSQLKKINSLSSYNKGVVTLEFSRQADMQEVQFEITQIVRRLFSQLPPGSSYPRIVKGTNPDKPMQPILAYSVSAGIEPYSIRQMTENIFLKELSGLKGIHKIQVSGGETQQLTIRFSIEKCEAWQADPAKVTEAINNVLAYTFPGSAMYQTGELLFLSVMPPARSIAAIENSILPVPGKGIIRIKDVADISIDEKLPESYFRINGKNAITVSIYARSGENKIRLGKDIRSLVQKMKNKFPDGYTITPVYDDMRFLEREVAKNYKRGGISILILFLFVLLAYRSWRHLLNLSAGLLVSVTLAIILARIFHISIHIYTIAGLAISFGIMTDNSIVMLDHFRRYGNLKIFTALLGATFTTIAVLTLVFFLPGEEKNNLADFSLIIILALLSSLVTALFFTPALYLLTKKNQSLAADRASPFSRSIKFRAYLFRYYYRIISIFGAHRGKFIVCLILIFGVPLFLLPRHIDGTKWYHHFYNSIFASAYYQQQVRPHTDKWLGGALFQFASKTRENSGYRDPEETKLHVEAQLQNGNTAQQMNFIMSELDKFLSRSAYIKNYTTTVYSGQFSQVEISFKDKYAHSGYPNLVKSGIIARSLEWGGVEWNIYGVGQGFSNAGGNETPSFRVMLKGYNYEELRRQADTLAKKLLKHKRIKKVKTNEETGYTEKEISQYLLNLDSRKTALNGTDRATILEKLNILAQPRTSADQVVFGDKIYPLVIQEKQAADYDRFRLINQPLHTDSSTTVRLSDIGKIELTGISPSIHKEDRQYIRMLSFDYMGGAKFGKEYLDKVLGEMKAEMPVGYSAEEQVWNWGISQSRRNYSLLILLLASIFFICSILFENLKQPFHIITIIPVSFIGLFITFAWGGYYFDQGGYAAFVMLGGLVANAAIFIVNDFNNLRKNKPGHLYNRLLIKATAKRARTIFLTTISTCCGLIPFLLEGQNEVFWFSLAAGTIGGLLFSLFALFIVLPVLLWKKKKKISTASKLIK